MSIVSVAIVLSFHLKSEPSEIELRMAKPLGIIFWCLAVACLCLGIGNYISKFLSFALSILISPEAGPQMADPRRNSKQV